MFAFIARQIAELRKDYNYAPAEFVLIAGGIVIGSVALVVGIVAAVI